MSFYLLVNRLNHLTGWFRLFCAKKFGRWSGCSNESFCLLWMQLEWCGHSQRWWEHSNPTCCLNFSHSQVVGANWHKLLTWWNFQSPIFYISIVGKNLCKLHHVFFSFWMRIFASNTNKYIRDQYYWFKFAVHTSDLLWCKNLKTQSHVSLKTGSIVNNALWVSIGQK